MEVKIINKCNNQYKLDFEKIIRKIIEKIPDKFLKNLTEIIFVDNKKQSYPRMRRIADRNTKGGSVIEFNMDYDEYNQSSPFSIFSLNIDFILIINEHVERKIKPASDDPEIKAFRPSRVRHSWFYFGKWGVIFFIFDIIGYPIQKAEKIRNMIFKLSKKILS